MAYRTGGFRMSVDAILKEIESLTDEEREVFFTRLDQMYPTPILTPELAAELDRRDAAYEANPTEVYTWEEVVAYVKRKK
jgi:putative addiction module component (TIGR02574 family)